MLFNDCLIHVGRVKKSKMSYCSKPYMEPPNAKANSRTRVRACSAFKSLHAITGLSRTVHFVGFSSFEVSSICPDVHVAPSRSFRLVETRASMLSEKFSIDLLIENILRVISIIDSTLSCIVDVVQIFRSRARTRTATLSRLSVYASQMLSQMVSNRRSLIVFYLSCVAFLFPAHVAGIYKEDGPVVLIDSLSQFEREVIQATDAVWIVSTQDLSFPHSQTL